MITEITKSDYKKHLISLDDTDRSRRFGQYLSDSIIENFVDNLDEKTFLYGIENNDQIATCIQISVCNDDMIEFGISVLSEYRGNGYANMMFKHGKDIAQKMGYDKIFMQCLVSNDTMKHIAKKNNMTLQYEGIEVFAVFNNLR